MASPGRRELLVSKAWIQGAVLVHPVRVLDPGVARLPDLRRRSRRSPRAWSTSGAASSSPARTSSKGQELFLTYGLMQFGTVYGHGAYLGPDFTADYLHRMAVHMNKRPTAATRRRGRQPAIDDLQANRYDPATGTLVLDRRAGLGLRGDPRPLRRAVFGRKVSGEGLRPQADRRPPRTPAPDHRLHRLDGVDGVGPPARAGRTRTRTTGPPRSWSATRSPATRSCGARLSLVTLLGGSGLVFGRLRPLFAGRRLARDRGAAGCGSCRRRRWR